MKHIYYKLMSVLTIIGISISINAKEPSTSINSKSSIEEIREELRQMNIPVLDFTFEKEEFPTFDVLPAPEGLNGIAITNNEYVNGRFTISIGEEILYDSGEYVNKDSGVRVKMRGNTSTAQEYIKKKSYKIKLSKKADLLLRGDSDLKDKDWCLIGNGSYAMNYVAGTIIAKECGIEWEPVGRHVCVIMNNQYMGSFYLIEAVKGADYRVNIDKTGYIIENDAYWWKPDEVYFQSSHLPSYVGWTFKEPDTDDFEEDTIDKIKNVIETFEEALYAGEDISEMYDMDSFASWLLAHDIMNTSDALGSNMFVVKENYNPDNIFETKLKMGPLWDFDDCFVKSSEKHAFIFGYDAFWYPELLKRPDFVNVFNAKWKKIKGSIKENTLNGIASYIDENPDLSKARLIDKNLGLLGRTSFTTTHEDYEKLTNWFDERLKILSTLIDDSDVDDPDIDDPEDSGVEEIIIGSGQTENSMTIYNSQGMLVKKDCKVEDLKSLGKGIYIIISGKERYKIAI